VLLLCWQPFQHTGCGGLPVSLPGLTLGVLWFLTLLGLCQVSPVAPVRWQHDPSLQQGML